MDESLAYVIAIDGGGTRCRFALMGPDGQYEVTLGSANVYTDRGSALATLNEGVGLLADRSGLARAALADIPIYAGLAGVTDSEVAAEVAAHLPARVAQVEDDRRSAVVGALGSRNGCVIGIGTGSFLARQTDGDMRLIGGYGALAGDDASGYWLGIQLLRRTLLAADGIAPDSPLTHDILRSYDRDPFQVVRFAGNATPAQIADLARQVIAAARDGDAVALALMQEGADYIYAGLQALGLDQNARVCAIGGVAAHYADYLPQEVREAMADPAGTALDGALQLARQLAASGKPGAL